MRGRMTGLLDVLATQDRPRMWSISDCRVSGGWAGSGAPTTALTPLARSRAALLVAAAAGVPVVVPARAAATFEQSIGPPGVDTRARIGATVAPPWVSTPQMRLLTSENMTKCLKKANLLPFGNVSGPRPAANLNRYWESPTTTCSSWGS